MNFLHLRLQQLLWIPGSTALALCGCGLDLDHDEASPDGHAQDLRAQPLDSSDGYNQMLSAELRFISAQPGADVDHGRAVFGLGADLDSEDPSQALFEGFSQAANTVIVSNGRSCFTCHRGSSEGFGLPAPPLSDHISLDDPLFTGVEADALGDPDALHNLDQLALFKYRVNRFDPRVSVDAPIRQVFGWRKSPRLQNVALQSGFLTDLRVRAPSEAARGAFKSHTQTGDVAFDDLFTSTDAIDIEAFMLTLFTDPHLATLRDPTDPLFDELTEDPYASVAVVTRAQADGLKVFDQACFNCHNTPNVFGALDNVEAFADGQRTPDSISWAPAVGRAYNIGVAERNAHGLRFTQHLGDNQFAPIVLTLANEDGTSVEHEVQFDIGLAMTTGRTADIGRFKVPQLRKLAANAPYFHDNSAATLEEVVDYFNSDDYNDSADGRLSPIHLTSKQRADLLEFLKIL